MFAAKRAAEPKAAYRAQAPFRRSRRYYRGRIVQALRELPAGASLSAAALLGQLNDRLKPVPQMKRATWIERGFAI